MLISSEMKALNEELHQRIPQFGTAAGKHTKQIYEEFVKHYGITDILDYGCGKNHFSIELQKLDKNVKVTSYDPGMPEFETKPEGTFEAVLCHDVLEHVEPELIDNVLQDIFQYGNKMFYLSIGLGPCTKKLADGRDNHLIQEPPPWWFAKLKKHGFILKKYKQIDEILGPEKITRPYVLICICTK
jgi:hypothetical protein